MKKIVKFQKENYSGDSYSAYYGMVNNIITRICLMEELSYSKQEIKRISAENIGIFSEIRKMEIQEYLSDKKYEEAIAVLKESKKLDADKAGIGSRIQSAINSNLRKKKYAERIRAGTAISGV